MGHYVAFVHGIGEQPPGCYDGFGRKIQQTFEKQARKAGKAEAASRPFVWQEVYWADVTQPDQQELTRRLEISGGISKFMVCSLGDVVAYSKLPYPPDKYGEVQKRFASVIHKLAEQAETSGDKNAVLDVVAHSLGTVIASDGTYDLQKTGQMPANLKLGGFFTLGSPIALFGLRYGLDNFNQPIRPEKWLNLFYPKDLIAFPLKPLNSAYDEAVDEDVYLSPSSYCCLTTLWRRLLALIPLANASCHSWYFTDKRVVDKIAGVLAQDLSC
jgi:hypothetical protein